MPHCTSSRPSSRPNSSQAARSSRRKRTLAAFTPLSPWIGSIMIPAVVGPIESRTAFMLLSGTWSKPGAGSPKPDRYFGLPVADSIASVRPWKAPSKQMMRVRSACPVAAWARRIILTMPSFASAPELQKNTLSANDASTSRAASRSACGTRYRLDTCITRAACSAIAVTRCGWPWPSEEVAMPAPKSRKRRPSAAYSQAPSPRSKARSARL